MIRLRAVLLVSLFAYPALAQFSMTPEVAVTSPELQVSQRAGRYDAGKMVDVAAGGGIFLVVWNEYRTDLSIDLFAARVTPAGEVLDRAGIPVATLEGHNEAGTRVLWTGSRFLVTWVVAPFSQFPIRTRAAEIDVNGRVLPRDGVDLVEGRIVDVAATGSRTLAVVERGSSVVIGAIDSPSRFTQIASFSNATAPQVATHSGGFVAFWFVPSSPGRYQVELQRFALDGSRIGGVQPLGELGELTGGVTSAAASSGNEAVIAVAGQNALRTGRLSSDSFTVDSNVTTGGPFIVRDVIHRGSGYDVVVNQNGQLVVHRYGVGVFPIEESIGDASGDSANGRTLLAWIRNAGGSEFNLYGTFVGETARFPIARSAANQQAPALATDGANVLGVWTEDRGDWIDQLMARRMTLDGTPFGATIAVTDGSRMVTSPTVAFNGSDYLAIWQEYRFATEEQYHHVVSRRITRDGVPADTVVISSTANVTAEPATATDGRNVLVVWSDGPYSTPRLRSALFAPDRYITPASIALPATRSPHVVWNGQSYFVVAADDDFNIIGMTVSREGALLTSSPVSILGNSVQPSVAWSGSGYLVVYERRQAVYAAFLDRNGARASADFVLHGNDGWRYSRPQVAWDGTSYVVTTERSPLDSFVGYNDLFVTRLAAGTVSGAAPLPLSVTQYHDAGATLLSLPNRRTLVAYHRIVPDAGFVQRLFTRTLALAGKRRAAGK